MTPWDPALKLQHVTLREVKNVAVSMQTLQGHLITFTLKLVPIKVPIFQVIEAKLFLSEWKLDKSWESSWITMSKPEISIYCLRWHQILKLQNVRMNPLCLNFKSFNLDGRWASSFWNIRSEPNEQQQQIWEGRASISRKHCTWTLHERSCESSQRAVPHWSIKVKDPAAWGTSQMTLGFCFKPSENEVLLY